MDRTLSPLEALRSVSRVKKALRLTWGEVLAAAIKGDPGTQGW